MVEALKSRMEWLRCPKCGGKTRVQTRPLFCPKCRYSCVIGFHDGKIEEIKMPDA